MKPTKLHSPREEKVRKALLLLKKATRLGGCAHCVKNWEICKPDILAAFERCEDPLLFCIEINHGPCEVEADSYQCVATVSLGGRGFYEYHVPALNA